jgi:hypothetical protein
MHLYNGVTDTVNQTYPNNSNRKYPENNCTDNVQIMVFGWVRIFLLQQEIFWPLFDPNKNYSDTLFEHM